MAAGFCGWPLRSGLVAKERMALCVKKNLTRAKEKEENKNKSHKEGNHDDLFNVEVNLIDLPCAMFHSCLPCRLVRPRSVFLPSLSRGIWIKNKAQTPPLPAQEGFHTVFRFPYTPHFALVTRLKIYQTGATVIALPALTIFSQADLQQVQKA